MMHLPQTDSVSELAAFWQTHEVVDFENDLTEVVEPVFQRTEQITIPFSQQQLRALRTRARRDHLSAAALIEKWVRERLDSETQEPGWR
ncbi:hypothetical protein [Thiorhodovibrio frisius]|uniref:Uncharacterized protein n=1 Tax=Thiorhodovibrio frisius TaxID=631362 RepID=H8YVW7_9GAMM|nr:hypothetical protein [Thiorhodovibrio frisius]EIC23758.1 hypothetical protein Thi970DRAFT_00265 [Thiorhodovibrio frisius]WPL20169.1 hypothetical protein Thiofri_00233 [Thiorhodovibrio frisius]